tara:strand:+ start:828 stop:1016 length:189 start_codon:yes stop_codon:yes gene_type:complete
MSKLNPSTTKEHLVHIYDKINNIENNHLAHIEKEIKKLNFILWSIGFAIFANVVIALRNIIF